MIDPRHMSAVQWCNQMVQTLASVMNAPKITEDSEWLFWAQSVTSNPTIRTFHPPDPRFFESWLEWAERFVQAVPWNFPGPSASIGLTWTSQGIVSAVGGWGLAYLGGGKTLMMDLNGNTFLSTDGGHTWTPQGSAAGWIAAQPTGELTVSGTTIIAQNADQAFRSTDGGVSFTLHNTGIVVAGSGVVSTDGAGNWIAVGNVVGPLTTIYSKSVNDGVTWSQAGNVTAIGGSAFPLTICWDGTNFVFQGINNPGPVGNIQSSTDGLNWTIAPLTIPGDGIFELQQFGGIYYGCGGSLNRLYQSATIAGLSSPSTIIVSADSNGLISLIQAGTNFFTTDFVGNVFNAGALTGPWTAGNFNFPVGDTSAGLVYDPVNSSAIALAQTSGQISTFP